MKSKYQVTIFEKETNNILEDFVVDVVDKNQAASLAASILRGKGYRAQKLGKSITLFNNEHNIDSTKKIRMKRLEG